MIALLGLQTLMLIVGTMGFVSTYRMWMMVGWYESAYASINNEMSAATILTPRSTCRCCLVLSASVAFLSFAIPLAEMFARFR